MRYEVKQSTEKNPLSLNGLPFKGYGIFEVTKKTRRIIAVFSYLELANAYVKHLHEETPESEGFSVLNGKENPLLPYSKLHDEIMQWDRENRYRMEELAK